MTNHEFLPDNDHDDTDRLVDDLTTRPFQKAINHTGYLSFIEGAHSGISNAYQKTRAFHDTYLSPTTTEHILEDDHPYHNEERTEALQAVSERHQAMYQSFNTAAHIDTDKTTVDVPDHATSDNHAVSHGTRVIDLSKQALAITMLTGITIVAGEPFGTHASTGAFAVGTSAVGMFTTQMANGFKATYHANNLADIYDQHKDEPFHDDTYIKQRVITPLSADAGQRTRNKHVLQSALEQATQNRMRY
mgnify:FL=1